jgi:hypothetical protein
VRIPHAWLGRIDLHNDGQFLAADTVLPGGVLLAT